MQNKTVILSAVRICKPQVADEVEPTDFLLFFLSLCLIIFLSICRKSSLCLSVILSFCLSVRNHPFVYQSYYVSVSLSSNSLCRKSVYVTIILLFVSFSLSKIIFLSLSIWSYYIFLLSLQPISCVSRSRCFRARCQPERQTQLSCDQAGKSKKSNQK